MAILHKATLNPTKLELVTTYLDTMRWGGGPVDLVGGYRYDDPQGKVGIEGLIATRGDDAFHLPLTYRDAPLAGAEGFLIATMDHSVLGKRWVYDATHDPVAVDAFLRALAGEQEQAELNVYGPDEKLIEVRTPPVVVRVAQPHVVTPSDLILVRRLELGAPQEPAQAMLIAEWAGNNSAVVAIG
ncbi:hypothetical protein BW730_05880 [Tessaracoccus aquimaris]|uniref:Maltokinase N-terminal cap domain-containing protein n=1 Tax=Tessaracoccus aquimaris TaxID=1332264 RepID=A0A1Q2CLW7_9ACTN|nr:hypothetical protein [Tessaracoccus aquimaris]AQP47114.1 hypothetical protein BW730_05880 [Tessaracoccus aquimaris]